MEGDCQAPRVLLQWVPNENTSLTPFKGLTRVRSLLTADLLASSGIRLLLRSEEGGREGLPNALSPFPAGRKERKKSTRKLTEDKSRREVMSLGGGGRAWG